MPDITISTKRLLELNTGLNLIAPLQPPPKPKGKYAFAKAMLVMQPLIMLYERQNVDICEKHARRDKDDRPIILRQNEIGVQYDIVDGAACKAEQEALLDEPVTLTGIRAVTNEELGDCPVPTTAYALLLGTLIVDAEPA
jgi:hypothetical protein